MAGPLPGVTLTRRRIVQLGVGAMVASSTGIGIAEARQDAGAEYTFVVAGVDHREGFAEHNTDVLMITRVNTGLGTVRIVSIPRDLYVMIPGYGPDRISRAFHHGYANGEESWDAGAQVVTDTVATNFRLPIDGIAVMTFAGFEQIIDALGGLEVVNPYEVEGSGAYPSFPEGPQTLTGAAALSFARMRSQDGDDGRVMRQRIVLAALLAELQQPDVVVDLPNLIAALGNAVHTDIPADVQAMLIATLPTVDAGDVAFMPVSEHLTGGTFANDMWVHRADWSELPGIVRDFLAGS